MRILPVVFCLAVSAITLAPLPARAEDEALRIERAQTRRALEIANLEIRYYLQVEYPQKLRRLDSAIRFTLAEIDAVRERLRGYGPYTSFNTGQPFLLSIQEDKLCLLDAELRLKDLRDERWALVRFHTDHLRLLELKAQDIRERLILLENTAVAVEPAI